MVWHYTAIQRAEEAIHWQILANRSLEDWQGRKGLGAKRAQDLQAFFNDPTIQQQANYLEKMQVIGFSNH